MVIDMERYALTGHPLGHSVSPAIHERLFALSGRSGCDYRLISIPPEMLAGEIETLSRLNGFNVTIPHKQAVIPLLAALDSSAARYGAVNTVLCRGGRTTGYNTDVTGFLKSVERLGQDFFGKRILVLGYGGAGRMMAMEAAYQGACEVLIAARRGSLNRAETLAAEIRQKIPACHVSALAMDQVTGGYDLVVNSTPAGMYPNVDAAPLRREQLEGCGALFDAVYNPSETRLMADARALGIPVTGGMTMLVWQAAAAHEIWYGARFQASEIERLIAEMEDYVVRYFQEKPAKEGHS